MPKLMGSIIILILFSSCVHWGTFLSSFGIIMGALVVRVTLGQKGELGGGACSGIL